MDIENKIKEAISYYGRASHSEEKPEKVGKREYNYAEKKCRPYAEKVFNVLKPYFEKSINSRFTHNGKPSDVEVEMENFDTRDDVLGRDFKNIPNATGIYSLLVYNKDGDRVKPNDSHSYSMYSLIEDTFSTVPEEELAEKIGASRVHYKRYSNTNRTYEIEVEFGPDEPSVCVHFDDDWSRRVLIEIDDETPNYRDAYYGKDENGVRFDHSGKGGYSKEKRDWDRASDKEFKVHFEFDEDPELNWCSKPLTPARALSTYNDLLHENPAYEDAIRQRTLDIYITDSYGKEVKPSELEDLISRFGKTKTTVMKKMPVEPAKWTGYRKVLDEISKSAKEGK